MAKEALVEAKRRQSKQRFANRYEKYQSDPHGFMKHELGDDFTNDINKLMDSVVKNPVTIGRSANGTGKTHVAARLAIWFYKAYPESQVFTTAAPPLGNLKRLLWGEMMSVVRANRAMFIEDNITHLNIQRHERSYITGVAIPSSGTVEEREAKFSGKHAPQLLFIVDEGDAVPPEVYRGIESCMSGGHVRLLIIFNPRYQSGPVYWKERDNAANVIELSAFKHPNVVTGQNVFPGAVDRNITVRRIHEWTRELADEEPIDEECFEVPEYLVGAVGVADSGLPYPPLTGGWRKIVEPSFYYMVLGVYPAHGETKLISQAWVEKARQRYDQYVAINGAIPAHDIPGRLGVDIAEFGTDANVAIERFGGLVKMPHVISGLDPIETGEWALQKALRAGIKEILVDGTGVGAGVAPYIYRQGKEHGVRAISVKVSEKPTSFLKSEFGEFLALRDQLWWAVREWLRTDPTAMLPPDNLLLEELLLPTYAPRAEDRKIKIMRKDTMRQLLRRSPDRADALINTFAPQHKAKVRRLGS